MLARAKIVLITSLVLVSGLAQADEGWLSWFSLDRKKEVAPVTNESYIEECGSCHFPYQPGLLPEASWRKLLDATALEDHFGDNAELEDELRLPILELLVAGSADKSSYKRSKKVMLSLKEGDAPLRITEVPYIKRKHHEIPAEMIKGNPKVKSLSYCETCHKKADDGVYDDDTVNIPGHGDWTW